MAAPNSTYSNSLLATTISNYVGSGKLNDQVHGATPLLDWYKKHQKPADSGNDIHEALGYGHTTQGGWFSKGETVTMNEEEIATRAVYDWKQLQIGVPLFDLDARKNRGKSALVNLAAEKMVWAKREMAKLMEDAFWAATWSTSNKKPLPLPVICDQTTDLGTIDVTYADWWVCQVEATSEALGTLKMSNTWNDCYLASNEYPTVIFADQICYEGYESLGGNMVRVPAPSMPTKLDLGFEGLAFKGVKIYLDSGCPSGSMYYLNHNMVTWRPHTDNATAFTTQTVRADNQAADLVLIWTMGAVTCNQRNGLAKISGKTAP